MAADGRDDPTIEWEAGKDRPAATAPPPGGPHDPDAPDRLEPVDEPGPPLPPPEGDDDGVLPPDPMGGEAPSG